LQVEGLKADMVSEVFWVVSSDVLFFQTNAKSMLKNVTKTDMEVADDVIEERSFLDSVKMRVPMGIKRGVKDIVLQFVFAETDRTDKKAKTTSTTSSISP